MKYDACHAAKDFVRTVWLSIDDLIYAESMVNRNKDKNKKEKWSVLRLFSGEIQPVLRLGAELSRIITDYSAYEPLLCLAKNNERVFRAQIESILQAEKYCPDTEHASEDVENYTLTSQRIIDRMTEDMRMTDISERLGCDYLRYMICLTEGAVRLAENALKYDMSGTAPDAVRSVSQDGREMLHNMRRLLSVIE